jgi:nicotinamidase/pyrazinamidase
MVTLMKTTYQIGMFDALLVTDIQIDFLPGGSLPIENGDQIIPALNDYITRFANAQAPILASRDWHPRNHMSFKAQGGPWPPHCVQNTKGANFSPNLKKPNSAIVISKATNPDKEAYSVFDETNLADELNKRKVKRLFIGGLATDYCIVNTVMDARKLGLETVILMDASLGINVKPGDVDRAIERMIKAGALQATADDFPDAVDTLPTAEAEPDRLEEKPSERTAAKKKARMRSRGASKRVYTERKS